MPVLPTRLRQRTPSTPRRSDNVIFGWIMYHNAPWYAKSCIWKTTKPFKLWQTKHKCNNIFLIQKSLGFLVIILIILLLSSFFFVSFFCGRHQRHHCRCHHHHYNNNRHNLQNRSFHSTLFRIKGTARKVGHFWNFVWSDLLNLKFLWFLFIACWKLCTRLFF